MISETKQRRRSVASSVTASASASALEDIGKVGNFGTSNGLRPWGPFKAEADSFIHIATALDSFLS